MPLWGTAHASDTNKPKFLPADENSKYNKAECYATQAGWVIDGAATGNGNTSADPEILVAIGGLAGATSATGLKTATITSFRFSPGTAAATDHTAGSSSQTVSITITWDEAVTVTGSPTVVVANDTDADHTCVYDSGTGTNRLIFLVASQTLTAGAVMTIGGSNDIALAGGTMKDTLGTNANASKDMGNVTAVTHTVVA
jgi:hypothetical protein